MSVLSEETWFSPRLVTPRLVSGAQRLCEDLGGMKSETVGPHFTGNQHPDCVSVHRPL